MRRTQRFGVNVLGRRHERFARSASPPGADRFAGVDWELGPGGVPLVTDALAALECDIVAEHPAGDHWIVVGHVHSILMSPLDDPLVFFAGAIGGLEWRTPRQLTACPGGVSSRAGTHDRLGHERGRSDALSGMTNMRHAGDRPDASIRRQSQGI